MTREAGTEPVLRYDNDDDDEEEEEEVVVELGNPVEDGVEDVEKAEEEMRGVWPVAREACCCWKRRREIVWRELATQFMSVRGARSCGL